MQLHNPLNLLLLLTTIPVIALYLLRLRRRDVKVPSTLLWDRMIRDVQANAPLQKLRVNLLLILQLLVLLLASLAFAAPFMKSSALSGEHQVLILDASLSMQSRDVSPSRFAAAQAEALKMIDGLRRHDEMMVIEAGARTRVMCGFTSEKATLRRAVEACAPRGVLESPGGHRANAVDVAQHFGGHADLRVQRWRLRRDPRRAAPLERASVLRSVRQDGQQRRGHGPGLPPQPSGPQSVRSVRCRGQLR